MLGLCYPVAGLDGDACDKGTSGEGDRSDKASSLARPSPLAFAVPRKPASIANISSWV